jgi:hypothetical protein
LNREKSAASWQFQFHRFAAFRLKQALKCLLQTGNNPVIKAAETAAPAGDKPFSSSYLRPGSVTLCLMNRKLRRNLSEFAALK